MKIPFTPGHGDGGLTAHRQIDSATEFIGPPPERSRLTVLDRGRYWGIVGKILAEDQGVESAALAFPVGEQSKIRPAFRTHPGAWLLKENTS